MRYIEFQRPKWCIAFSKFPVNAISLSSVLENEARRLLGGNCGCTDGEKGRKHCNKTDVAGTVQKGKISLIEMEALAAEGIA